MNDSSQQDLYSITLDSDTLPIDTITCSNTYDTMLGGDLTYAATVGNITIDLGNGISYNSSDTISIDYFTDVQGNLFDQEWIDSFPDWYKIKDMCEKYPSLEIAMRNFKTVYDLIKDDYDSQKNQDSNT